MGILILGYPVLFFQYCILPINISFYIRGPLKVLRPDTRIQVTYTNENGKKIATRVESEATNEGGSKWDTAKRDPCSMRRYRI
jgi:hypothetical protein